MFYIFLVLILFSGILWITVKAPKKPSELPKYGNALTNRNHLDDLKKAKIESNDLYLCEYLKRDTLLSGPVGV